MNTDNHAIVLFFMILTIFVSLTAVNAEESPIDVKKTAVLFATQGENVDITITLTSRLDYPVDVIVEEQFSGELVSPKERLIEQYEPIYRPPYLMWNMSLEPREERELEYTVKSEKPGLFTIIPTGVYFDGGYSKSNSVEIKIMCNGNRKCETEKGENYLNCPDDCTSGMEDGNCDLREDGRCDPDCDTDADPDCVVSVFVVEKYIPVPLPALIIIIAAIGAFLLLYYKIRRRGRASEDAWANAQP